VTHFQQFCSVLLASLGLALNDINQLRRIRLKFFSICGAIFSGFFQ
jgi:hypothetical protein